MEIILLDNQLGQEVAILWRVAALGIGLAQGG